jgi:hypothetical protein
MICRQSNSRRSAPAPVNQGVPQDLRRETAAELPRFHRGDEDRGKPLSQTARENGRLDGDERRQRSISRTC